MVAARFSIAPDGVRRKGIAARKGRIKVVVPERPWCARSVLVSGRYQKPSSGRSHRPSNARGWPSRLSIPGLVRGTAGALRFGLPIACLLETIRFRPATTDVLAQLPRRKGKVGSVPAFLFSAIGSHRPCSVRTTFWQGILPLPVSALPSIPAVRHRLPAGRDDEGLR